MIEATKDAISALRRAQDDLADLVSRLDEPRLATPSGASEWTIAQVLSHLGSASEIGRATLTTGRADLQGAQAVWDRWNALAPAEQAAGCVAAGGRLVAAFEDLDDDALATRRLDMGFLPEPIDVGFFADMRLSEMGLHRWDIDVAFDPGATVAGYLVPFMLGRLPVFAGFFAQSIDRTGTVAIDVSDPDRSYVLEMGDEGTRLQEARADEAGTRLGCSGESLLRLVGGRLAPGRTPESVTVEGELSLDDLRRVFPGY